MRSIHAYPQWLLAILLCRVTLFTYCHELDIKSQFMKNFYEVVHGEERDDDDGGEDVRRYPLLMPNVTTSETNAYLCTPFKIHNDETYYIVGYEPKATMHKAHHILLFGCGEPGATEEYWNCGEMSQHTTTKMKVAGPCGSGGATQIIYAWGRDAPSLKLPNGVGFKVGRNAEIKYLVLQVHYSIVITQPDNSGIYVEYTRQPLSKLAGVLVMGTGGEIPAMAVEHMETACQIQEDKQLHPFAYRTHTHRLGRLVQGYRVRTDAKTGAQNWTLLGMKDPLKPQMFYPIMNAAPIRHKDYIAARCTMVSDRPHVTLVGPTGEHEMCNFYLMYYVERQEPLSTKYCFSRGPPFYYWNSSDSNLHNLPPRPKLVV